MGKFLYKLKGFFRFSYILQLSIWAVFLGSLMIKCFYFQFTTRISELPIKTRLNANMLISSFGVLVILAGVIFLIFNRKRNLALFITDLFLSLLLFSDTLFFRYYRNLLSIPVIYNIGAADKLGGSIISLLKPKDIVYVIDLPVIAVLLILISRTGARPVKFLVRAAGALAAAVIGTSCIWYSYSHAYTPAFKLDNNYIARYLGVLYFHFYDTVRFVSDNVLANRNLTAEEKSRIEKFYEEKKARSSGTYLKNAARGRNLIIIQVESLQEFVIGREIDGQEITPFMNKLIGESLYFNNIYYQVADGNTSDAEFLANVSLHPLKEGSVFIRYSTNYFPSLPSELKKQGYSTYAFHANKPSFWNRSSMYSSLGFDRFFSGEYYKMELKVGWGISDSTFFRQSLELMDGKSPFYGYFITLSTHFPYNFDYSSLSSLNPGNYKGTLLGDYFQAVNYVDACLEQFFEDLKKRGLYENSMIVIFGDHHAIPRDENGIVARFLGVPDTEFQWARLQKVPLIIHLPGTEHRGVISVTGGEIDIYPTIANLMGIDSRYAMGKDLLNCQKGYAVLRNGSLATDRYIYLNSQGKAFDLVSGKELEPKEYESELKACVEEYEISQLIIKKNAFKHLKLENG